MRVLPKLAVLLILAGCEQPAPIGPQVDRPLRAPTADTFIRTNAERYRPGAVVSMRLTNPTTYVAGYNLCRSALEASQDGDWRRVQQTLAEACTAELRTLAPGQSATYAFRTSTSLKRGVYRIVANLHNPSGAAPREVVSNTFNIDRDADD